MTFKIYKSTTSISDFLKKSNYFGFLVKVVQKLKNDNFQDVSNRKYIFLFSFHL